LKAQIFREEKYSIKSICEDDIETIRIWRNEQKIVLRQSNHISRAAQVDYFNASIWPSMILDKPNNLLMSFFLEDSLIGYGGLVHIDWLNSRGEVSFLVDTTIAQSIEKYRECHAAFLALLSELAFEDLGLNKIYTVTWDIRGKHIKNLETAGFCLDGVLREHVSIDGKHHDALIHSILKDDRISRRNYE